MKKQNIRFVKPKPATQPGFIYLLNVAGTNKFKIGRTVNVIRRINELQTGCPLKIRYVYHAYVSDTSFVETELHHKFSGQREIGEWFTLTATQVKDCILLMRLAQELEPQIYSCPTMRQHFDKILSTQSDTAIFDEKLKLSIDERLEMAQLVIAQNLGIEKTILALWGLRPGGRNHYLYAEARNMLDRLIEQINNNG